MPARFPRSSGVLLHPTCLSGPYGIGDIGPAAHGWIDALASAHQTWWQILPVGPTGEGDSPYKSFSTFAGNLNLLSPELLLRDGLIRNDDVAGTSLPSDRVDYVAVEKFKASLVRRAWELFQATSIPPLRDEFERFRLDKREWLDNYALFMALRDANRGEPWYDWPAELRHRDTSSLAAARRELADEFDAHRFGQFLFFRQWHDLRVHARERGIRLIGDVPIFVAPDSADVWASPRQFLLDESLRPKVVAGVPPDYFSTTGQLWGNPLYDWEAMRQTGYSWWISRLRSTLELVDVARLDHFRGFCATWHVPASEPTAENGRWVPGPGADLFNQLQAVFGELPLIAEDLGQITKDVYALRDAFRLPGMKVLQFAFDTPANPFLPHHYPVHCVAYTGTHDNNTTRGWLAEISARERDLYHRYTARDGSDVTWDLIRLAWASVADLAIAPLQDILDLGAEARMNVPGVGHGNWRWRMPADGLNDWARSRLVEMTEVYGRVRKKAPALNEDR